MEITDELNKLLEETSKTLIKLASVEIGDNVTFIGKHAFNECKSLTSVIIPDGVTLIGYWAFASCRSLTSVVIPNSIRSIGDQAFGWSSHLKEIKFKGTKKQAMQCGIGNRSRKRWREYSSIEKIICTDGVIEL